MRFGVFDHMDRGHVPLGRQYEDRLQLIEAYERAGFHAFHLAEHHANPVGLAPAPSVFLAAVAQRTRKLRFGPLVYTLALHHPLRLIEEICMLDQMSGGRLELGIGRGISPIEQAYWGNDPAKAQAMHAETLAIVLQGLRSKTLDHVGEFYTFRDVPLELTPVQKPHPPLWYGLAKLDSVIWCVRNSVNVVIYGDAARVRTVTDRYRAEWAAAGNDPAQMPLMGMNRHIVVAETDAEALAIARRAYPKWYQSLMTLWFKHNMRSEHISPPDNFDEVVRMGMGFAGSPASMRDWLGREIRAAGINYQVLRIAYGDLTLAESLRTVELLSREVMPALSIAEPVAA